MKVLLNDKVWDKEEIHNLLDRSSSAVGRALMVIYENQTADEKAAFVTRHQNGVGFTGRDAEWLTDVAKKWIVWRRWASDRQCDAVRKAIKKYHRQLLQHMLDSNPAARLLDGRTKAPIAGPAIEQQLWGAF